MLPSSALFPVDYLPLKTCSFTTGACTTKLFTAVIFTNHNKLECLPMSISGGKVGSQTLELSPLVRFSLACKYKLGWKGLTVANTLAYHNTAIIATLKIFQVQAPGAVLYNFNSCKIFLQHPKIVWLSLLPKILDKDGSD